MPTARKPRPDGEGKQPCRKCGLCSIRGMRKGYGLCPYHWAVQAMGQRWADSVYLPLDESLALRQRDEGDPCKPPN